MRLVLRIVLRAEEERGHGQRVWQPSLQGIRAQYEEQVRFGAPAVQRHAKPGESLQHPEGTNFQEEPQDYTKKNTDIRGFDVILYPIDYLHAPDRGGQGQ